MPATLAQFTCPACAQPFLSRQHHELSVQVCPHCAFTGAAGQFLKSAGPAAPPMNVQRRQPSLPLTDSGSPPTAKRAVSSPAVDPSGWVVREYPAIGSPAGSSSRPDTPPQPVQSPRSPAPEPNWEAAQAYADGPSSPLAPLRMAAAKALPEPEPAAGPGPASPPPVEWSPMKPSSPPKLSTWPGMTPPMPDDSPDHFIPRPQRSYVWPLIAVLLMVLAGVVTALVLEEQHRASTFRSASSRTARTQAAEPRTPAPDPMPVALPRQPSTPASPESRLSPGEAAAQIEPLLQRFFAATTLDERLACIADATNQRESVNDFFGKATSPIEVTRCHPLNIPAVLLPGGHPCVLCEVTTSYPSPGTAIVRLASDPDGTFKLHWPTLADSLQARLYHFGKDLPDSPLWVNVGIRRTFGFDEKESVRSSHFVFDIQGLGNGDDRTVALAAKDQPIGRSLDHLTNWNQLYMVRALLHCVTIEGRKRIVFLDADLAGATDARQ